MFWWDGTVSLQEMVILPFAVVFDLVVGELPERAHPTVWMGKVAKFLQSKLRTGRRTQDKINGTLLVFLTLTIFVIPVCFLSVGLKLLHWIIYIPVMTFLLKSTFSVRGMEDHVKPIEDELRGKNLEKAKEQTSSIVSRDTKNLDTNETISAAIESTGEGITDGIVSPLFYFIILGVPGAIGYRVVNTLDSMYGYRDPRNENFGWASAKLDTVLNYIPARISVFFISVSAWITGENWKGSIGCARKEGVKTQSLNAGFPMAAVAGALNVRLEKKNSYVLGIGNPSPSTEHIEKSLKIMKVSAIIFSSLLTIMIFVIFLMVS